jgi:hypothetical protein
LGSGGLQTEEEGMSACGAGTAASVLKFSQSQFPRDPHLVLAFFKPITMSLLTTAWGIDRLDWKILKPSARRAGQSGSPVLLF